MNVELVLPGGEHPGGVPPPPSVLTDHPMIEHYLNTRDPTPCRISDVTSRHRWLSSAVYAEFLRPLGTPHLLVIPVQMGQTGGFAYSIAKSGRDFTDRDRGVAMMFQAALVVHHRAVERRLADAAPAAKTVLTPREQQVMALIATGASAKAIGRLIGRSERTVHKHLENVYGKLGVGDRVTAVNILRSNGWL
jgi:DNA-binding CsgD family transcriptional regulator